jgi:hypothetical protein
MPSNGPRCRKPKRLADRRVSVKDAIIAVTEDNSRLDMKMAERIA